MPRTGHSGGDLVGADLWARNHAPAVPDPHREGRQILALFQGRRGLADGSGLNVPEGTVYPLLSRLKAEGLLSSDWVEADAGHPRKYYRLTAAGRRRVVEMARFWKTFSASLDNLLAPVRKEER